MLHLSYFSNVPQWGARYLTFILFHRQMYDVVSKPIIFFLPSIYPFVNFIVLISLMMNIYSKIFICEKIVHIQPHEP
jgi:hypothetical protein